MAITTEARNDIIGLVVAAYNAAPGSTLLNELVGIISDGGTLDDVAMVLITDATLPTTNVTDPESAAFVSASERWDGRYPNFQTPEEFAAEWLGHLIPEASAAAREEAEATVVEILSDGNSFANVLLKAQIFLSTGDETNPDFGESVANFNNKVEAATYHTVNLELDGSVVELQDILVGVTSDDSSVEAANERSGQFEEREDAAINLTTAIDNIVGTITDNTVNGSIGGTNATYQVNDSVDLGAGNDTINVSLIGSGSNLAGQGAKNAETINITAKGAVSADASGFEGHTAVWVRDSDDTVTVTGVDAGAAVGVAENTDATNVSFTQAGSNDGITLAVGGGSTGKVTLRDSAGEDGFDTVTIATSGASSTIGMLDGGTDFESLIITGDQGLTAIGLPSSVQTIDASGNSGGVTVNATASRDLDATGGSGLDTLVLHVDGGANISRDLSVDGFETVSFLAMGNAEVDLDLIIGASTVSLAPGGMTGYTLTLDDVADDQAFTFAGLGGEASVTHNGLTVKDTSSVAFSFNNQGTDAGAANNQMVGALTLNNTNSMSITADDFNNLNIASINGRNLESITYSGDSNLVLGAAIDAPDLEDFDGSDATGDIDLKGAFNNDDVEESEISTGSGDDTVTNTALTKDGQYQYIDTGAGDDTFTVNGITVAAGNNDGAEVEVDLGDGDDTINLNANANNGINENFVISGGDGDDTAVLTDSAGGNVTLDSVENIRIEGVNIAHTAPNAIAFAGGDLGRLSIIDISDNGLYIDAVDGKLDAGDVTYLGRGRLQLQGSVDGDTITASGSGDVIRAGKGADSVTLGGGADTVVLRKDDGGAIPVAETTPATADVAAITTLTLSSGFDTVAGFGTGDSLDLPEDDYIDGGTSFSADEADKATLGLGDGEHAVLRGSLNGSTFTLAAADATGEAKADTLVLVDVDSSGEVDVEAIVLTDYTGTSPIDVREVNDVMVSIEDVSVDENVAGGNVTFTATLSQPVTSDVVLDVAVTAGTATLGVDLGASLPTSVTIDADTTEATFTVPITDDNIVERNETFTVTLSADPDTPLPDGVTISDGTATATGTITENDTAEITLTANTITATENETFSYTVNLSNPADEAVVVRWTATDIDNMVAPNATVADDLQEITGTVTFNAGTNTAQEFTIHPVSGDGLDEATIERFGVYLSADTVNSIPLPTGVSISDASDVGFIEDSDRDRVNIAFENLITEVDENVAGGNAIFTVTLGQAVDSDVVLGVRVAPSRALGNTIILADDLGRLPTSVTIDQGETEASFAIPIINDDIVELSIERFGVSLFVTSEHNDVSVGFFDNSRFFFVGIIDDDEFTNGPDTGNNESLDSGETETIDTLGGNDTFNYVEIQEGGMLRVNLGAGDDTINLGDIDAVTTAANTTAANVVIDGGTGTDTVNITASTAGNVTLSNIEVIVIGSSENSFAHDINSAISFENGDLGNVVVTDNSPAPAPGTGLYVDAVGGVLDAGDATSNNGFTLLGADDVDDVITASNSGDAIDAGSGADTIILGMGSDVVILDEGGSATPISGITGSDGTWQASDTLTSATGFDTVADFTDRTDFLEILGFSTNLLNEATFNDRDNVFGLTQYGWIALAGTLSADGNTFSSAITGGGGPDTLLLFDASSSSTSIVAEAVVLTGFAAINFSAEDTLVI